MTVRGTSRRRPVAFAAIAAFVLVGLIAGTMWAFHRGSSPTSTPAEQMAVAASAVTSAMASAESEKNFGAGSLVNNITRDVRRELASRNARSGAYFPRIGDVTVVNSSTNPYVDAGVITSMGHRHLCVSLPPPSSTGGNASFFSLFDHVIACPSH